MLPNVSDIELNPGPWRGAACKHLAPTTTPLPICVLLLLLLLSLALGAAAGLCVTSWSIARRLPRRCRAWATVLLTVLKRSFWETSLRIILLLSCGDVERNPGPRHLTVASINVTSLYKHFEAVTEIDADVIGIQETALTTATQTELDFTLAKQMPKVWNAVWSAPRPPATSLHAGKSIVRGKNGGVGLLCRKQWPLVHCPAHNDLLGKHIADSRVMHSMIAMGNGRSFLHVFVVYAAAGNAAEATDGREDLLGRVLLEIPHRIGDAPAIVLGDLNTDHDRSPTLRRALDNHWIDASARACEADGSTPPQTFHRGTASSRIDYVLLNKWASLALVDCKTYEVCTVKGHSCVSATLNLEVFNQTTLTYRMPKEIPPPQNRPGMAITVPDLTEFHSHITDGNVELAWKTLSTASETFALAAAGIAANEQRPYHGRGDSRKPIQTRMCAPSSKKTGCSMTEQELRVDHAVRKLTAYVAHFKRSDGPGVLPHEVRSTWKNRAPLVLKLAAQRRLRIPDTDFPNHETSSALLDMMRKVQNDLERTRCAHSRSHYKRNLTEMFDTDRKELLTWLRATPQRAAETLSRPDGSLTANVEEMDRILQDAWNPILRLYSADSPEPEYKPFAEQYGRFIRQHPMETCDITGRELRDLLRKKKKKSSACGIDGWRMCELERLPDALLEGYAKLYNLIERTGVWPEGLLTALVTLIPKGCSQLPTDLRPITVTSAVYRLWACRRLMDVTKWQEHWALPSQHGFRPNHRGEDVIMEITTLIEESLLDEDSKLYILALDFQKCFDRVPQELVLKLAEDLGMHQRVIHPLRTMYRLLKRRFKMPLGVGEEFEVTNGILQGCPLSVILINALLFIMLASIEEGIPGAFTESFADDANLMSRSETAVQVALTFVEKFCVMTGMKLNEKKTVMLGITKGTKKFRKEHPYESEVSYADGTPLHTVESHKLLGVIASTAANPNTRSNTERTTSVYPLCSAISEHGLLPFHIRSNIVTSVVMPTAMYGCAFHFMSTRHLSDLRTRVTTGIWGTSRSLRSRNQTAVLAILNKGHLADPCIAVPYNTAKALLTGSRRSPRLAARVNRILLLHGDTPAPLGPVGLALLRTPPGTICWGPDITTSFALGPMRPFHCMDEGLQNHILRDVFRAPRWAALAEERPSYNGVALGVDTIATNKLRLTTPDRPLAKAVTSIIAGAFHRAGRWTTTKPIEATDLQNDADADDEDTQSEESDMPDGKCLHCTSDVNDGGYHLWFECTAFASTRDKPQFAKIMNADRTHWPPCLTNWGVVPTGVDVDAQLLHVMMGSILLERAALGRTIRTVNSSRTHRHAWRSTTTAGSAPPSFDFASIPDSHVKWPYSGPHLIALKTWLGQLHWSNDAHGEISIVELALDFEVHSGLLIQPAGTPTTTTELTVLQRGQTMSRMLSTLTLICTHLELGDPLPATRVKKSNSLRSLGAPVVSGGYSPRALISETTMAILEAQLQSSPAHIRDKSWGKIVPRYAQHVVSTPTPDGHSLCQDSGSESASPPRGRDAQPRGQPSTRSSAPTRKRRPPCSSPSDGDAHPPRKRKRPTPSRKPPPKRNRNNPEPPPSSEDDADQPPTCKPPLKRNRKTPRPPSVPSSEDDEDRPPNCKPLKRSRNNPEPPPSSEDDADQPSTCKPSPKRNRKTPRPPSSSEEDEDRPPVRRSRTTLLSSIHEKSGPRAGAYS